MGNRILIIEDEEKISRFVQLELEHEGYQVQRCGDGRTGLDTALSGNFDCILLDIMLPELNGLEVLRRLRKVSDVPVVMLTARDAVMDKVSGLDMGADDYVTKPFAIEELLARIRRVLRNATRQADQTEDLQYGALTVQLAAHEVHYDGQLIELTGKEFDLLVYLLQNRNVVLTRDRILENVWDYAYGGQTNIVDVYVRYLRNKIDEPFGVTVIRTVRGVGYVIKD